MRHVYVGVWALGCFHSNISIQTFQRALTASVYSCAEIKECGDQECLFSGVTKSGRVWRNLPERCRKAMFGVWAGAGWGVGRGWGWGGEEGDSAVRHANDDSNE